MTISDTKRRELDVRGTTGSALLAGTTLGVALVLAQYAAIPLISEKPAGTIRLAGTDGTVTKSLSLEINELDILKQIYRIHDNLLESQVELDYDSKHVLYSNLWNLYST
jgi:hypothetical protein